MKKYTIHYNFCATADIEVLANSKEEAREKADMIDIPLSDFDYDLNEKSIIDEEDVPDLRILIEKAEHIISKAEEEDIEFILNPWPRVTTVYWDGNKMEYQYQLVSFLFWNNERNEIGFNTVESAADYGLSEIPEIEQLEICQSIIAQAEENGIINHQKSNENA